MKTRRLVVAALCAVAGVAAAGPQDIDLDACDPQPAAHVFAATTGATLTATIPVLNNGGGRLYFAFSLEPRSTAGPVCQGASAQFICNGITIELPGLPDEPAPPDAQVRIAGAANAVGTFVFKLLVAPEDGSKSCEREYRSEMKEPPRPKPPDNLRSE